MGSFSDRLGKRLHEHDPVLKADVERLRAVAIMRNGEVLERGFKSHWQLRAALNPERLDATKTIPGDTDGFITTTGRFVTREEAKDVAIGAGQIGGPMGRPLLSSDIEW